MTTTTENPFVLMPRLEEELPTLDSPRGLRIFFAGFFGFLLSASLCVAALYYASAYERDHRAENPWSRIKVTSHVKNTPMQVYRPEPVEPLPPPPAP